MKSLSVTEKFKARLIACTASMVLAVTAAASSLLIASAPVRAAGVPVIDAAAITQMITELMQLMKQYDQLVRQYELLDNTRGDLNTRFVSAYNQFEKTMTGTSRFAGINPSDNSLNFLPVDVDEVLQAIRTKGASALPAPARSLYREFGLGNACERMWDQAQINCYKRSALQAMRLYSYQQGEETAKARRTNIQNMIGSIESTSTQKEVADMQARIAQEQASLANEKMRIDMLQAKFAAEEQLLARQQSEALASMYDYE